MLPIDDALPDLLAALETHPTVLLTAPPGAGKTTRVPPALLGTDWLDGRRIVMLEPRRLAARSAARFMAGEMGETVGRTVGYRTRLDTKVSKATRIEVVTEGILTRMIQSDPELADYACVIFDEFHERSLRADLGLALVRESQQALRADLRVLVMSATLAVEPLKALLDDPPLIVSEGRSFPVDVHYRPCPREKQLPAHVAASIRHALDNDGGSLLVFLPGMGEIRRVADLLDGQLPANVTVCPLHGNLKPAEQDAAIAPAPDGVRKVVLATAIAESSLTIEGIRVVIDAGLQRRSRFDANSGMSRLVTESVSRASSAQRAGRAGRLEPGVCYRLWSESQQTALRSHTPAEILDADLAPMVLELAHWGIDNPGELTWLDAPPQAHWQQAVGLLRWLDALDESGRITTHGRAMLELGLHPRLAHMVIRGRERNAGGLTAELAALLSDRDLLGPGAGADMGLRLNALRGGNPRVARGRLAQARKLAAQIAGKRNGRNESLDAGCLLALAFPDRIACSRGGRGRYRLSNGRGAFLFEDDPLAGEDWLVAAEVDGQARESRIFLAAAVDPTVLESDLADHITNETSADWDERRGTVIARRERKLGALVLESKELERPDAATIEAGLLAAVWRKGLDALPWTDTARQWQARVQLLHGQWPERWPDVDDNALLESIDDWLRPFLAGLAHWRELEQIDLFNTLNALLDYDQQRELTRLVPTHLEIPTGRRVRLDYTAEGGPVLATKLQSVFGWTESPKLADGRVPVVLHLLSPAQRPLAVTADLASFWTNAYPDVRKDMRGRYPKHPWPEDPLRARPREGVGQA
ncbi:ATP-dependent helicase HrpB [Wenzhouxiangella sp. AB-CW3]|uniref:ATP-dependent helicase HrpB n=1 Tax=Wenzhouxiangella sp. AB-CW3 TaxID=2771012 RepID=UPI00168BEAA7|nr:ATP-dependent helicase HrpB [Wenzhouxiangella sp. AB-CW3]QOC22486.1 ATP-dependent helicase HrpB [Wenzhouxiangella sp. AB-CW3]